MSQEIASLYATLGVKDQELQRGLVRAETRLNSTSAAMSRTDAMTSRLGQTMKRVAKGSLIGLGIGAGIAGTMALKSAYDFESAMLKIHTLVGVAKSDVDAMRVSVMDLATSTNVSAKDAADGMYFIQSAGLRGAEAMETLEAASKASAIGLGEVATIADLATSALNAYSATGLTATEATDILIAAVREGKLAPEELAGSMGRVLPIASNLGVSFNEVGAAMAAMSRTGTNAAEGATQLRSILQAFVKPSSEAAEAMASVGTSAAEIRQKIKNDGLLSTLKDLNETFGDNDELQAVVFGRMRALTGVMDLLGQNTKDTEKIFASMEDTTGLLNNAFEEQQKSAGFKLEQAIGQSQRAMEDLGRAAMPVLTGIAETANAAMSALRPLANVVGGAAGAFNNFAGSLGMLGFVAGGVIGSLSGVQNATRLAWASSMRWNGSMRDLTTGMASSSKVFDKHIAGMNGVGASMRSAGSAAASLGKNMLRLASPMLFPAIAAGMIGIASVAIPAIVRSFSGAETAAQRAHREFTNLKLASEGLLGAGSKAASAELAVIDALDASARATQNAKRARQELANTKPGSVEHAQAERDLYRAQLEGTQATDQLKAAREQAATSIGDMAIHTERLSTALMTELGGHKQGTALMSTEKSVRDKASRAVQAYGIKVLATSENSKALKDNSAKLAKKLKTLGYDKAAKAAARLAEVKKPDEATEAVSDLNAALVDLSKKDEVGKNVNKDLETMGDVGDAQWPTLYATVDRWAGQIEDRAQRMATNVRDKAGKIPTNASPSNIPKIKGNFANVNKTMEQGIKKMQSTTQSGVSWIRDEMGKTGDLVGSWSSGPGIRSLLSTASDEGILIPKAAVRADAVAASRLETLRNDLEKNEDKWSKAKIEAQKKKITAAAKTARAVRNNLQKIVDDHQKAKDAINTALEGTKIQMLGELDKKYNGYAVGTAQSASIVKGAFARLQDEVDSALKNVDASVKARGKALDKALRGILVDNLDAVAGAMAPKLREIAGMYAELEQLRDPKNKTDAELAIDALEKTMREEDRALAEQERNAAKEEANAKLREALRWGDAEAAAAARKQLAQIERDELRAAREITLEQLNETAQAERDAREEAAQQLQEDINDRADAVREGIESEAAVARDAINASGEARRMLLQQQYDQERKGIEAHIENMRTEMEKVAGVMAAGLGKGRNHAKLFAHSMAGWGNRAGRYFANNLAKGLSGVSGKIRSILQREVAAYLELHSPADKGPLSNLDKWWKPMGETLMKPVDLQPDLSAIKSLPVSGFPTKGSFVINVSITDQTFAGMSREQADKVARQIRDAMDRQVRVSL